jgi:carboxylesterase
MSKRDFSFFFPGGRTGVLLIHGLGGTPTEMRFLGKRLARRGLTVLGVQLAGHCGSEADLIATGWANWYASVEAAHERLREHADHVFVAGLSMGALLAVELATRRPEACAGIALYSTTLHYDGWNISRFRFLLPLILALPFGRRVRITEAFPFGIKDTRLRKLVVSQMEAGESGAAGLPSLLGASLGELRGLVAHVKRRMKHVKAPALVIHSVEDDLASAENALYLARHLGGPAHTVLLNDCYHMITVDQQREEVARLTADFICNAQAGFASRPVLVAAE